MDAEGFGFSTEAGVMGLDGVEIVMRTEESFGIEIPDEVAETLLTPAALVDFVAANGH
jgi:acyl carrier protein